MIKNILVSLAILVAVTACQNGAKSTANDNKKVTLTAAGATFPMPYYNLVFKKYTKSQGTLLTYGGIGSGGGIRSLKDKVVDFGASDAFLTDDKIAEFSAPVVHIPTCLGAVVVAYNLPGVDQIKLTNGLLEGIFMGDITKWNDAKIKELNQEVNLPDLDITVVFRSDGSGTTFIFSDFMSKISQKWADAVGLGKSLNWPVGIGAKGNPGVAGTINQTTGAIGYIGSEYALAQKISTALLQNAAGNYIEPTIESISAAAKGEIPADTRVMLTNSDAADAYPISGFTWILLYKDQAYDGRSYAQAEATVTFLDWLISAEAQAEAPKVNYAPLPTKAVTAAKEILKNVTYEGKAILK